MRHYYTSSPWDHGYFRPRGSFDAAQGPYGIKNVSFDCAFECTPSVFLQIPSHLKALCMWVFLCLRPGTGPATIRSSGFLLTQKSPWCFQLVINAMLSLLARTVDLWFICPIKQCIYQIPHFVHRDYDKSRRCFFSFHLGTGPAALCISRDLARSETPLSSTPS